MKLPIRILTFSSVLCFILATLNAQSLPAELEAYQQFLQQHQDMSTVELLNMHPAGTFKSKAPVSLDTVEYASVITSNYNLTSYETSLLQKYGFMVSERLRKDSFVEQFRDVWQKDLPVFISSDAILHAFHFYYDELLKTIELGFLIEQVQTLLADMHAQLPTLEAQYAAIPEMLPMLKDVDVYLTIPRQFFDPGITPYFSENASTTSEIMSLVAAEQFAEYPMFSEHCKLIDFSQFKPRGHYVDDDYPILAKYFRAMIWLGRIEIYLLAPQSVPVICPPQSKADIQRQTIDAVLLLELMELSNAQPTFENIEEVLQLVVGEQDNVTPVNLETLTNELNISNASQLLDTLWVNTFQDSLKIKGWAFQRILSQLLASDPMSPDQIVPASAMMLFGQRFVIDSYVTGNVVYDRILYQGSKICRLFPSTLDVLFALGNSAAAQLLAPETDQYHYASNLAALRYLIDNYDNTFWNSTIYTKWLSTIRAANPPDDRSGLPAFMQTGAWWQQKMNTQLSSWTELRHDHLLYAKQSYTGIPICSYPYGYVEPVPELYRQLKELAAMAYAGFDNITFMDSWLKERVLNYYQLLENITEKLETIAQKELDHTPLTVDEEQFLKQVLYEEDNCAGPLLTGWYVQLLANPDERPEDYTDFLVADYHTTPADCNGGIMGWISHAGTGYVDMAVITAKTADGQTKAFTGPVMSYHEYRTTNFLRLTDDEWEQVYLSGALRPDWVNLYLADVNGESRGSGGQLITAIKDGPDTDQPIPRSQLLVKNYPNPFNSSTIISFTIPAELTNAHTTLTIYNIQGQVINQLFSQRLPSGNYLTRWEGRNDAGDMVTSGVYFYELICEGLKRTGRMILLR